MSLALGKKIMVVRRLKRFTQRRLAENIGISISQLSIIERGRKFPQTELIVKIADTLGVSLHEFFILPENIKRHALL